MDTNFDAKWEVLVERALQSEPSEDGKIIIKAGALCLKRLFDDIHRIANAAEQIEKPR